MSKIRFLAGLFLFLPILTFNSTAQDISKDENFRNCVVVKLTLAYMGDYKTYKKEKLGFFRKSGLAIKKLTSWYHHII